MENHHFNINRQVNYKSAISSKSYVKLTEITRGNLKEARQRLGWFLKHPAGSWREPRAGCKLQRFSSITPSNHQTNHHFSRISAQLWCFNLPQKKVVAGEIPITRWLFIAMGNWTAHRWLMTIWPFITPAETPQDPAAAPATKFQTAKMQLFLYLK